MTAQTLSRSRGLTNRIRNVLDNPFRRLYRSGVSAGKTVAEIGAGAGYFTIPAALIVGASSQVYAVEPDPMRVKKILMGATKEGLENVRVIPAKAESIPEIRDGSIDLVFSFYSMHHVEGKQTALTEISRILKPGGTFYMRDILGGTLLRHGLKMRLLDGLQSPGLLRSEMLLLGWGPLRGRRIVEMKFVKIE